MKKFAKIFGFCLILFGNGICKGCSCSIEDIIKESLRNHVKNHKRQLPDNMEDDSGEVFGGVVDREAVESSKEDTASVLSPTQLSTTNNTMGDDNCNCKLEAVVDKRDKTPTTMSGTKQPADLMIEVSREVDSSTDAKKVSAEESTTFIPTTARTAGTRPSTHFMVLNETHFELKEAEFQTNMDIKEVCPHYKDVPELDVTKMADVWQLIYYKAKEKLTCFKIFLKKTSQESRLHYKEKFSSFNDTIYWNECFLELTSTGKQRKHRKHFLQGSKNDRAILENIVVSEHHENETKIITLQEQTPDQWLVTKNLLIMRDCDNGDVVMFTRLPSLPDKREMEEAMLKFGEDGLNGTVACEEVYKTEEEPILTKKYQILS